jgi:two-component system sensor histidine kinase/response regulator
MGGDVGVDSVPGQGSTFWLTARLGKGVLAETINSHVPTENAEAILLSKYRGTRVLLAEDERINQEVARTLLGDAGIEVDLAEDGVKALRMAQANNYAVILMDMQMPKADGLSATRAIRALDDRKAVPIIAMTANAFAEDRKKCLDAGMNDFIAKPVDPDLLYEVLLKWISRNEVRPGLVVESSDADA